MYALLCAVLVVSDDPGLWQRLVHKLSGPEAVASTTTTEAQRAWAALIRSRTSHWETEIPKVAAHYAPVTAPATATIVIGAGGGQDAFTHDATTIGFDVARLHAEYGDATTAENAARIDRFFRHEYTHLFQKAWLREHPYTADTPLRAALLGMWTEGLGNYYSLSEKWRGVKNADIEPRTVARLAALACASPENAAALTQDLSVGHFDRKWGALPVALWLAADEKAIRELVLAGPDGIWTLADRNLPDDSRSILREARAAAALCTN